MPYVPKPSPQQIRLPLQLRQQVREHGDAPLQYSLHVRDSSAVVDDGQREVQQCAGIAVAAAIGARLVVVAQACKR